MIIRNLAPILAERAKQYPVVTLTGPRQAGKTTLCRAVFDEYKYANLEDPETRLFAQSDPRAFLVHTERGFILDEFQRVPELASYIQAMVDKTNTNGQFILSGSQQLELSQSVSQSLAGRSAVLKLLPFTVAELYPDAVPDMQQLIFNGFMPRIHDRHLDPTEALASYVSTYVERDLRQLSEVHNLRAFNLFLKVCATLVGQTLNFSKIGNDIGVNYKTVQSWLSLLEASYIVFTLPPYFRNLRKRVVKAPKLYFYDVGLATFLLGAKSAGQVDLLPNKGSLFENLIVADVLKSTLHRGATAEMFFYRDQAGYEVDLILDRVSGPELVEIKMGATYASDFVKNLHYYSSIDERTASKTVVYSGHSNQVVGDVRIKNYVNFLKEI